MIFAIVGEQRSGTILLGDMLNSHPDIKVFGELFLNFPATDNPVSYFDFLRMRAQEVPDCLYPEFNIVRKNLLTFFNGLTGVGSHLALGFQLKYDQIGYVPELLKHLKELDFKVVHVLRKNILDIVLSQIVLDARHSIGLKSHTAIDAKSESIEVELPPSNVILSRGLKIMERVEHFRKTLKDAFVESYLEVVYPEYLEASGALGYYAALEFLGVELKELRTTLRKSSVPGSVTYLNKEVLGDPRLSSLVL